MSSGMFIPGELSREAGSRILFEWKEKRTSGNWDSLSGVCLW